MTWKELLNQGRVERIPGTREEFAQLRAVAERSPADARLKGMSVDGRFGHAYEAARALASMVIRAAGYRVRVHGGGHYNTFLALEAADAELFAEQAAPTKMEGFYSCRVTPGHNAQRSHGNSALLNT